MRLIRRFGVAGLVVCGAVTVIGQSGAANGEWRSYGGDLGHTRYAPLDQVNASNFIPPLFSKYTKLSGRSCSKSG